MCPSQTHRIHIVIRLIEASKKASFTIGDKISEICANEVYEWSQRCFLIAEFWFIVKALMQSHSFSKHFLLSKERLFLDSFCKIRFSRQKPQNEVDHIIGSTKFHHALSPVGQTTWGNTLVQIYFLLSQTSSIFKNFILI